MVVLARKEAVLDAMESEIDEAFDALEAELQESEGGLHMLWHVKALLQAYADLSE